MMQITFAPPNRKAEIQEGTTILRAAGQAGLEIVALCGARGRCRSCRVHIRGGRVPPATLADRVQLGDQEVQDGYRLACQTEAQDGLTVHIAPALDETSFQILTESRTPGSAARVTVDSGVQKTFVTPGPPESHDAVSDLEEIFRHIGRPAGAMSLESLREIPSLLRSGTGGLTAAVFADVLLAVEPGDTRDQTYGMAFDIGTTTVVGYLVDLTAGALAATVSSLNPQSAFGGDVMSRVAFAQEDRRHVRMLRSRIIHLTNKLIAEACERAGITRERIYKVTVVGNTVMHHLFLGIDPTYVGQAPFTPALRQGFRTTALDVGLRLSPRVPVCLLPIVAGFVGADAVGMVLATRLHRSDEPRLAVDIGTNGEVVMGSKKDLMASSTPAGPALEGAHIMCGMRGALGAIDQIVMDRAVHYRVIGGGPPLGICGSGVLDAVAGLLNTGLLDRSGRLQSDPTPAVPDELRRRMIALPDGQAAVVLVRGFEAGDGRDIVLTQADIRQIQLAKAAIRSSIALLQQVMQTPDDHVAELMLAGGFGNYLNISSAVRIGLIPPLGEHRISYVGNAAGLGAQLALISEAERRQAEDVAGRIHHLSLASHPEFQQAFVDAMLFP